VLSHVDADHYDEEHLARMASDLVQVVMAVDLVHLDVAPQDSHPPKYADETYQLHARHDDVQCQDVHLKSDKAVHHTPC
jgi:hypothetical protein